MAHPTCKPLTPEKIENWRKIIASTVVSGLMVGPYAYIMPDAEVQRYRDRMQQLVEETNE